MNPYLQKPWKSKSRKRQMATLAICLSIGGGLSYFLMHFVKMELLVAALCGAALCLVLFLMATFCVCFKASRVQALNETIAEVAQNFVREVDLNLCGSEGQKIISPAVDQI